MSNLEQLCKIAKYTVLPRKIGEDRQPEQIMSYFEGAKVCTSGKDLKLTHSSKFDDRTLKGKQG